MQRIGTYDQDVIAKAIRAYGAGKKWEKQSRMKMCESELPLISERYKFGGTLDAMFVQDELSLGDFKTSNTVYVDYLVQVIGGYALLWDENFPNRPISGFHLLRFSKDGDFAHHYWQDIPEAKRAFLLMRELYDLMDKLKKRV